MVENASARVSTLVIEDNRIVEGTTIIYSNSFTDTIFKYSCLTIIYG